MKLALLLALTTIASAQSPLTPEKLAKTVDAHYNHLHSLQCRYTELYQGLGLNRSESGTLTLRKPGRMRWAYDTPAGKLFLLDGHSAISYTPGDPQAQLIPQKQLDDLRSPLRFLLGHTELAKELDNLTLTPSGTLYTLTGTPHIPQPRLKSLTLTVDATGVIHTMRLEDSDGALTTFTFSDLHEDLPTPDSLFTFTPPPGIPIVKGNTPL